EAPRQEGEHIREMLKDFLIANRVASRALVIFPMHRRLGGIALCCLGAAARNLAIAGVLAPSLCGQTRVWNWEQIKTRFLAQNPSVLAGKINIEESKANEITAGLRPNPQFSFTSDGLQTTPFDGVWRPLTGVFYTPGVSQLIERRNKRQLRVESA